MGYFFSPTSFSKVGIFQKHLGVILLFGESKYGVDVL
jgi:hypothetical protein